MYSAISFNVQECIVPPSNGNATNSNPVTNTIRKTIKRKDKAKCGCYCDSSCNCDCTCESHCYCAGRDKCELDCRRFKGRNLIVSIDGTSNQFGSNNTNVVELHSRIIRKYNEDDNQEQLKCYLSGIGTALPPSRLAFSYWKVKFGNWIDLAVAWSCSHFLIFALDLWLMDHYRPGDRIFLFGECFSSHHRILLTCFTVGFSRGAYQIRTLAGIIHTLGLLEAGNKSLIPLYVQMSIKTKDKDTGIMVDNFKKTFSHKKPEVRVHFVGAWDTVSSIGVIRQMPLPFTNTSDHVCYFRHALALDECRVKFIPEYLASSEGSPDVVGNLTSFGSDSKEVWFAGSHSDIIPLLWMENQARIAGLVLDYRPSGGEWDWKALAKESPTNSLTAGWYIFEDLPITSWQFFSSP
ncbi:hypothetical protein K435DRAFT_686130, partial [Dendrothele bispora CBS 962.96]